MEPALFILLFFVPVCISDTDDLKFTCSPQLGCEIFNVCTRSSMVALKQEIEMMMESRLAETSEEWNNSLTKVKEETLSQSEKGIEQMMSTMQGNLDARLSEFDVDLNSTLENLKKQILKSQTEGNVLLEASVNSKIQEATRKVTNSLKKSQSEMQAVNERKINELRDEMGASVDAKITVASKKWSVALQKAKNELTTLLNKAMHDLKSDYGSLHTNVRKASTKFDVAIFGMEDKVNRTLERILKENINPVTLEEMIDSKIRDAIEKFNSTLLSPEIQAITHNISLTRRGLCKVAHGGKCFWVIEPEMATPYAAAADECLVHGGEPANIYSNEHYEKVETYLRSLIYKDRSYIDVWLGMKCDTKNGDAIYTNGSVATFVKWEPGSPATGDSFSTWTRVYFLAKKMKQSIFQGMVNSSPENIRDGVLCEI